MTARGSRVRLAAEAAILAAVVALSLALGAPADAAPGAGSTVPGGQTSVQTPAGSSTEPSSTTTDPSGTTVSDTTGPSGTAPTTTAPGTTAPTTTAPTTTVPTTTVPTTTAPTTTAPGTTTPPTDPATPVPTAFSSVIDANRAGQEELAAAADRLSVLVMTTADDLDRLEVQAEGAADTYRRAEADLAAATTTAARTGLDARAAAVRLAEAQADVSAFARSSYISGSTFRTEFLLLDSAGPGDLIERQGLLESVASSRTDALSVVTAARARTETADVDAGRAVAEQSAAQAAAKVALDDSTAQLASSQATLTGLLAQKADYDAQFYASLVALLGPEGAAVAFADYQSQQQTQEAAAAAARAAAYGGGPVLAGRWALPLAGTLTTCFCQRWGTMHWGIDIAAPMYTPEYAAGDGVVLQAGPATGFGQAVYIAHDNGDVTVYGHMEVIEVVAGQRVSAGQEIALVGSQGFSTGPHLHFEVHVGGAAGARIDPVLWLAQRGIFL